MSGSSRKEFAFDECKWSCAKAAKIAGPGPFECERGGDSGCDSSGFAERGQRAADDDAGGDARGRVRGHAVSILPKQELAAGGGAAKASGSDARCDACSNSGARRN